MKDTLFVTLIFVLLSATCLSGQNTGARPGNPDDPHKVIVKEVLQTTQYTYLFVSEGTEERWLALPKTDIKPGKTYYYRNGYRMTDFESRELRRKFETIWFLGGISTTPEGTRDVTVASPHPTLQLASDSGTAPSYTAKVDVRKEDVSIRPANNGITISELFANKEKYNEKIVRISGKVTKFNAHIMKRNWIHIQDGTEFGSKFDLTATTDLEVTVGETIVLEGKISLNKDFGYGYSYEVLLEDARLINK